MEAKYLSLQANTELHLIKKGSHSHRVLELVVRAPESATREKRPALNVALVLDRSGSMHGAKLAYVRQAAAYVLDMLTEGDRAAVIAYDHQVMMVAESTPINAASRQDLKRRIAGIESGGNTNLSEGWFWGCQQVAMHIEGETARQINRVLLLTDGLANEGITGQEELAVHAYELSSRGVSTSTFGVGEGYNENLLEVIAQQGRGSFYFIAEPEDIPEIFKQEFEELSAITARDVEIELDLPEGIKAEVLGGLRTESVGQKLRIFIGSLTGGREQPVYLNLEMPLHKGSDKIQISAVARATGLDGQVMEAVGGLTFQYARVTEVNAAPLDLEVRRKAALARLSHTASHALKLEREGRGEEAARMLETALSHERMYLPADQVRYYEEIAMRMRRGMEERDRKAVHYEAYLARSARVDATYERRREKR